MNFKMINIPVPNLAVKLISIIINTPTMIKLSSVTWQRKNWITFLKTFQMRPCLSFL
jgi:hypothetical protein